MKKRGKKHQKNKKIKKNFIINLIILVATLFLIFFVAEILSKNFHEDVLIPYYDDHILSQEYIESSDGLIYNQDKTISKQYLINEKRHGDKILKNKKENIIRVGVLGDSFTEGAGVEFKNETFPYQLQEIMNIKKALTDHNKFEVLAFGRAGLNSFQEYIILKELAIEYDLDYLVLQFCSNDLGPNMHSVLDLYLNDQSNIFVQSNTDVLRIGNIIVPALPLIPKDLNIFLLKQSSFLRFVSYKLNIIDKGKKLGAQGSMDYVGKMNEIAEENDITFFVVNFPSSNLRWNPCGQSVIKDLKELTSNLEIPFKDLCDYLDLVEVKSEIESEENLGHYNKEGYRITAEIIGGMIFEEIEKKE